MSPRRPTDLTGWAPRGRPERDRQAHGRGGDSRVGRPAATPGLGPATASSARSRPAATVARLGTARPAARWAPGPAAGPAGWPQPLPRPRGGPAAHKPGAMPLRPLVLGDIFDGAFRIIRYNPKATSARRCSSLRWRWSLPAWCRRRWSPLDRPTVRSDAGDQTLSHDQVVGLVSAFGVADARQHPAQSIGLIVRHRHDRPRHGSAAAVGRRLTTGRGLGGHRAASAGGCSGMAFLLRPGPRWLRSRSCYGARRVPRVPRQPRRRSSSPGWCSACALVVAVPACSGSGSGLLAGSRADARAGRDLRRARTRRTPDRAGSSGACSGSAAADRRGRASQAACSRLPLQRRGRVLRRGRQRRPATACASTCCSPRSAPCSRRRCVTPFSAAVARAAVPRPADPQGGLRRGAARSAPGS